MKSGGLPQSEQHQHYQLGFHNLQKPTDSILSQCSAIDTNEEQSPQSHTAWEWLIS